MLQNKTQKNQPAIIDRNLQIKLIEYHQKRINRTFHRFFPNETPINLIDVLYDKKIKLTLSLETRLEKLTSSKRHFDIFKRTISRLHEMTKVKNY